MRVHSISLYSDDSEVASFGLVNADFTSPYLIKNSVGLDATEITPKFYASGGVTKRKFYDLSLQAREVVLRIGLNPQLGLGDTFSSLRDDLYKAIASSRTGEVQLRFNDGIMTVAALTGFVSKFEALQFSANPEVQITIKCEQGMFQALSPIIVHTESLSITEPVIIDNLSTAPHGFKAQFTLSENMSSFTIKDAETPEWKFELVYPLLENDVIFISSETGNKYLYLVRGSEEIPLLDKLSLGAVWPVIFPKTNEFIIDSGEFVWDSFTYYSTYWGV